MAFMYRQILTVIPEKLSVSKYGHNQGTLLYIHLHVVLVLAQSNELVVGVVVGKDWVSLEK